LSGQQKGEHKARETDYIDDEENNGAIEVVDKRLETGGNQEKYPLWE